MKKLVFASVLALASVGLVPAPTLRAQDSITIKDPVEFNAWSQASTQADPKAKASGLEAFLTAYPQSVVKKAALDMLIDTYQGMGDADHALSAATRLLQVDPGNMKAIFLSVAVKKSQCQRTSDVQTCDDAALLARKGLTAAKPAGTSDDDWKKQTAATYPIFHSAIATDDVFGKKDFKAAVDEYRTELMLFDPAATTVPGPGLSDTLNLAEAYAKLTPPDMVNAVWFYARAWNFAPANFKPQIEKKLDYWYNKFHGGMDGLDAIKSASAATVFPPGGAPSIKAAPTPAEIAHNALTGGDPGSLNLGDKEYILANGTKEDQDKLWALLKDKATPVPGTVSEAPVGGLKVAITQAGKTTDFAVQLKAPTDCKSIPGADAALKDKKDFILTNGVKDDTDKITAIAPDETKPITKLVVEGTVSQLKLAVTQDAKDAKTPDFIVNLKAPAACKEVPAAGSDFGLLGKGDAELDGTYDSYTQVPATATVAPTAQIVLREGLIQAAPAKKAAPAHKPSPAHHAAAH